MLPSKKPNVVMQGEHLEPQTSVPQTVPVVRGEVIAMMMAALVVILDSPVYLISGRPLVGTLK